MVRETWRLVPLVVVAAAHTRTNAPAPSPSHTRPAAPHPHTTTPKRNTAPLPLSDPTLAAVAEHVASLRLRLGREPRVVALLGAGASASAGLPDWRSPTSGLYSRIAQRAREEGDAELAACPGLVFAHSHFRRDPSAFYRAVCDICLWPGAGGRGQEEQEEEEEEQQQQGAAAGDQDEDDDDDGDNTPTNSSKRRRETQKPLPKQPRPTAAHHLLAALERRGSLLRAYTQNVDGLEHDAGCSDERVVQAHGGFREAHCAACGAAASPYAVMQALAGGGGGGTEEEDEEEEEKGSSVPRCASCGERAVKPAVVLFGERLPARFHRLRLRDLPQCELLIVLGTALAVEPFASLLGAAPRSCPRVLVNRCAVRCRGGDGGEGEADKDGFAFVKAGACRDVAVLGECDDGCLALAEALGGKEMRDEVERGWRRGGR